MVMVDEPEDLVIVGEQHDAGLARQMNAFINDIQKPFAYTGISAFVIIALMKRMRVFMWIGLERTDIVECYAPWASGAMTSEAQFEAIGCVVREDEHGQRSLSIPDRAEDINHWVAGINTLGSHGDGASPICDLSNGEFAAIYFSLCMCVIETIADGSCGIDTMCLMLGLRRSSQARNHLRCEVAAFVLKHIGNRALVAVMHSLGEVHKNMGLFELEAAGAVLLADNIPRGDGGSGGGTPRSFTDEENRAVRWKCRLWKASPEAVLNVIRALPEWCIKQTVQAYKERLPAAKPATKDTFIITRDHFIKHKCAAARQFINYFKSKEGGVQPKQWALLKKGRFPKGWFPEYVDRHSALERCCRSSTVKYNSIARMYKRAVQAHLRQHSAVAEDDSQSQEDEEMPYDRFRYHTPRKGQQYFSTWNFPNMFYFFRLNFYHVTPWE